MSNKLVIYSLLFTSLVCSSCNYCKIAEEIAKEEVIGIVESKEKLTWNRDEQTIVYKDINNQDLKYYMLMDNSGLWDFVQKGDSLYKPLNMKSMKVYRNGELAGEFLLDIGCTRHLENEE